MTWRDGPGWRLNWGDSRDMHSLADATAHLVLTGPPFFSVKTERLLKMPVKYQVDVAKVREELSDFAMTLLPNFSEMSRVTRAGGYLVIHTKDIRYGRALLQLASSHRQLAEAVGFELRTRVLWRKTPNLRGRSRAFLEDSVHGAFQVDDLEEFLVFQKPGPEATHSRMMSQLELRKVSEPVWEFPAMGGVRTHPYQSPAKAIRRFIELLTRPGELVVDPFAGRATTLWCAVKLGREAVGWEIEERHFSEATRKMYGVVRS